MSNQIISEFEREEKLAQKRAGFARNVDNSVEV